MFRLKVVVAIDSFKGSISSADGSKAIASGIKTVFPFAEIVALPLADGGEGTVEALVHAAGGEFIKTTVTGPLGTEIMARYGVIKNGKTAVIEVAEACGLDLVPTAQRNPLLTTTFGVGQLILHAIGRGCREFVIGLGGSATNDGGVGMLQALGFQFLDENGQEVARGGGMVKSIRSVDTSQAVLELKDCRFRVACDVNNVLHGPTGASHVFGPQKGATPEMVASLDAGLRHFGDVLRNQLNIDLQNLPGSGAAGGLGGAFAGFLQANLESGIELILNITAMEEKMQGADFVITGEGKLDDQTAMGKAPLGVAQLAAKQGIPVIALAGAVPIDASSLNKLGITSCFSISNGPMSLEEAMDFETAFNNLKGTAEQIFGLIQSVASKTETFQQ
ncbi:Glycerate 2-kinase [Planococcus massiliensis]|uniref:Glycerate 2-kinase n=1 Tax=Planococcus massiliensis TaxID=1499687 RepID=A0A098EKF2_9BACL|nr:glycerate kinase [Planococcus massiliensis]CEG21486.1 Glycerate 2-kinase [Planococcus massiliensis]